MFYIVYFRCSLRMLLVHVIFTRLYIFKHKFNNMQDANPVFLKFNFWLISSYISSRCYSCSQKLLTLRHVGHTYLFAMICQLNTVCSLTFWHVKDYFTDDSLPAIDGRPQDFFSGWQIRGLGTKIPQRGPGMWWWSGAKPQKPLRPQKPTTGCEINVWKIRLGLLSFTTFPQGQKMNQSWNLNQKAIIWLEAYECAYEYTIAVNIIQHRIDDWLID